MKAKYVSVWDNIEIISNCKFNPFTKIVSDIETSNIIGDFDSLTNEYVIVNDKILTETDGIIYEYKNE